ncbi:hypothetical protein H4217_001080 [Coemansia sp. RSA 1939]|nr:hypothetical protein H4217_001080 [Coemansia sp. RSA 1939]KAJ2616447.1 hypothetical protein EV177_001070 [Coemansia sp. RSA 1804]KAJ2694714.1 hypothetical protein GGH99_000530 [Coemansia sp. RSA 1285]
MNNYHIRARQQTLWYILNSPSSILVYSMDMGVSATRARQQLLEELVATTMPAMSGNRTPAAQRGHEEENTRRPLNSMTSAAPDRSVLD